MESFARLASNLPYSKILTQLKTKQNTRQSTTSCISKPMQPSKVSQKSWTSANRAAIKSSASQCIGTWSRQSSSSVHASRACSSKSCLTSPPWKITTRARSSAPSMSSQCWTTSSTKLSCAPLVSSTRAYICSTSPPSPCSRCSGPALTPASIRT